MAVKGQPKKFHKKFKFVVEIDGVAAAAFQKAGPLSPEVAVVEQHEGGSIIPVAKDPGRMTFPNMTLERGMTQDLDLYRWFVEVANAAANGGLIDDTFKRNLDVVQQDRDGSELRRYRVFNAWPRMWGGGEWDNTADENLIEKVELVYDRFEIVDALAPPSRVAGARTRRKGCGGGLAARRRQALVAGPCGALGSGLRPSPADHPRGIP